MASPIDALRQKESQSSAPPQPPVQAAAPQAAPRSAPAQDNDSSNLPDEDEDESAAGSVNLMKLYSKLNSAVTALFDGLGVRRSLTLKQQKSQSMADHIADVSKALQTVGGITQNFVTASHTKHDPDGGSTVAHSTNKLKETIVPKDCEPAKVAIAACKTLVSKIESLIPDKELNHTEPPQAAVDRAKSQLSLIAKSDGAGMSAWDLGAALISVPHPLLQTLARLANTRRHGGEGHASLVPAAPPIEQPEQQQ